TDMAEMISSLSGNIMSAITVVLVAFSSISLIVSSIMIGIIMYISVLERTKEIGILRALGARKRDISRVFNAETMIIGLCSGTIGILVAQLLTIPANIIIEDLSGLANVAKLNPLHAIILVIISVSLTLIGGLIPAKMASRKDPVIALRTE
ncbi:MAG: FtsX-like permease family protein, partial [Erysipelotrichia bacterium]|nr:FtsX-like permease family protein [Erysipelotrichia bacterium]